MKALVKNSITCDLDGVEIEVKPEMLNTWIIRDLAKQYESISESTKKELEEFSASDGPVDTYITKTTMLAAEKAVALLVSIGCYEYDAEELSNRVLVQGELMAGFTEEFAKIKAKYDDYLSIKKTNKELGQVGGGVSSANADYDKKRYKEDVRKLMRQAVLIVLARLCDCTAECVAECGYPCLSYTDYKEREKKAVTRSDMAAKHNPPVREKIKVLAQCVADDCFNIDYHECLVAACIRTDTPLSFTKKLFDFTEKIIPGQLGKSSFVKEEYTSGINSVLAKDLPEEGTKLRVKEVNSIFPWLKESFGEIQLVMFKEYLSQNADKHAAWSSIEPKARRLVVAFDLKDDPEKAYELFIHHKNLSDSLGEANAEEAKILDQNTFFKWMKYKWSLMGILAKLLWVWFFLLYGAGLAYAFVCYYREKQKWQGAPIPEYREPLTAVRTKQSELKQQLDAAKAQIA